MATINIGEMLTTTLRHRNKKLADNVTRHNILLSILKEKGKIKPVDGGRDIVEELEYAENTTTQWYTGYEEFNVAPSEVFDAATFDFRQLACVVTMSGLEQMKNAGKERIIDLLEKRIENAEKTLANELARELYNDGTTANKIGGLRYLIADDPTASATVGGINQNTYSFWRNQTEVEGADNTILTGMGILWRETLRGTDHAELITMDSNYIAAFEGVAQLQQRFMSKEKAEVGFDHLMYKTAKVVYDVNNPANRAYFINPNYLYLRPHKDRQFVVDDERKSFNQDAFIVPLLWGGNLTCSNRSLQGVLKTS